MNKMTFNELVEVECKVRPGDNNWKKIFVVRNGFVKETMRCVLCDTSAISKMVSIKQHVMGKKHQRKFETCVSDVRHPKINPLANANKAITKAAPVNVTPASVNVTPAPVNVTPAPPANLQTANKKEESKIVLNPVSVQKKQQENLVEKVHSEEDVKNFREGMSKMTPADLLLIEYKFVNTDWKLLFKKDNSKGNNYSCSMCKNATFTLEAIKSHMSNRQHQRNIELVKNLHHPKIFPAKGTALEKPISETDKKPDKIALATTESTSTQVNKSAEKPAESVKNDNKNVTNQAASNVKVSPPAASNSDAPKGKAPGNESKPQNQNETAASNIVINPANVQKLTVEASTTGKNLRELMKTLDVSELLKIEFHYGCVNSEWKQMFKQFPDTTFKCLLCGTFIIKNLKDLRQHIESVRHNTSIDATQKLFHPTLAPTKTIPDKEEPATVPKNVTVEKKPENKMDEQAFRQHLKNLTIEDFKKVEFLVKGRWKPLISTHGNIIMCNLCDVTGISSHKTFLNHLGGRKHSEIMVNVEKLFHPVFTYAKDHIPITKKPPEINTPKKTVQAASDSQIICTITLEDSPEREIPSNNANKNSEKVVNPAAIIAQANEQNMDVEVYQTTAQAIRENRQTNQGPNVRGANNNKTGLQQTTNSGPLFKSGNRENQRGNTLPHNTQQGEKIITPRVRPSQNLNDDNKPSFSTKNLISSKVEEVDGLIGVEYVVKILRNVNDTVPRFECCLCEFEVDGVGMQFHLKGITHRKKFLERHFPTAMRQFAKYKDDINVMSQICEKLAIAVEKYHGRDLPFECLQEEFRSNRDGIMSKVFSFRHASEHSGPSFTNIVDKNMVDEFIANKSNYRAPEPDPKRRPTFDMDRNAPNRNFPQRNLNQDSTLDVEQHRVLVEKFLQSNSQTWKDRRARSRSRSPRRRRSRSRSRSRGRYNRNRSPPRSTHPKKPPARFQWDLYSHTLKSPVRKIGGDIWDSYRRMFDHAVEDLDRDYKEYKRDPEKHPIYDEEWRKYWNKKSRKLRDEGIDPSTYNFQPGWVRFISRRVHQLYEDAVEDIRIQLRKRLGLPNMNSYLRNDRYHIGVHCVADPISDVEDEPDKSGPIKPSMQPMQSMPPMQPMNQRENYQHEIRHAPQPRNIPPEQSPVPFNRDEVEFINHPKPPVGRPQTLIECPITERTVSERPKTIIEYEKPVNESKKDVIEELEIEVGPLSTVSVLRLLTALEDQLGSLGPKVIDLLSKALTLEKVKPNSADESLLTVENCVFLETVKEKLKGQILAGVIEGSKIKAVKQAIRDLTKLLEKASMNPPVIVPQKEVPKPVKPPAPKRPAPSTNSAPAAKLPCLDKQEVAAKLAAALTAQGKTDFSPDQLEQLVAVYTLIEKKQREANKPGCAGDASDQQKKSLSETLLDFLKPTSHSGPQQTMSVSQPPRQQVHQPTRTLEPARTLQPPRTFEPTRTLGPSSNRQMQQTQNLSMSSSSNAPMNTLSRMGTNMSSGSQYSNTQPSRSSLLSYNFSQLSNFDTSLSLPSFNRNPSSSMSSFGTSNTGSNQIWSNMGGGSQQFSSSNMNPQGLSSMGSGSSSDINMNSLSQNLSNLIQGITNRGQNSPNMGTMRSGQSSFGSTQQNQSGFGSKQSSMQNQGSNSRFLLDEDDRQLYNAPVLTSTTMNPGRSNPFSGDASDQQMVSYPSNNIWRNQAAGSNSQGNNPFNRGGNRSDAPIGWQRNNFSRR